MAERAIIQASKHPRIAALLRLFSDKAYFRVKWFARRMPYRLNLKNPQTFNEKLQWIKLYDRNPLYTTLVDKYRVKEYVRERIGDNHVIPLLGVWDNVDEIEWDKLPQQFVLKVNHDCGGHVICKDKTKLDIAAATKQLRKAFERNYYYEGREWPYKNVQPKVFAEAYMEDEFGELRDYKFFCFDGEVKAMFIASNRQTEGEEVKFDFFDTDFNHLPFTQGHPNAEVQPPKPKGFEEMKRLAATLSKGIPEVRVDFYDVNGHIYFGEFTFFHFGGMVKFNPVEWDYKFGDWIKLPKQKKAMKILCLVDGLGSGGAERQIVGLALLLKEKGYKVNLAYYHKKKDFFKSAARQGGIEPILLSVKDNLWSKLKTIRDFIKKQNGYDWVIAYKGGPNAIGCLLKLTGLKYKLIVSERNTTQHLNWHEKMKFSLYRYANHVVPNSYSQSEFMAKHYPWMGKKIVPITNFTDTSFFAPYNKPYESRITILTVARIAEQKNVMNYLEAISRLKKHGLNGVRFEWYGNVEQNENDYAKAVKKKISALELTKYINFHPSTANILECYQKCDIFCLPSNFEGYPNVVCEAMSCGKPIVCSRVCDNPIIISENENGILFDPRNPDDIADKLKQIIEMPKDVREKWGRRSREIALEKFSKEVFVNKYIDLMDPPLKKKTNKAFVFHSNSLGRKGAKS